MSVRYLEAGTVVDQRYSIVSRLGEGGMAEVYCAQDLQLGRKVALKLLHSRFAADPDFVERFRREASAAAGLQHPNVVGVYDRGDWDGTHYIAMEYLEGRSLQQILATVGPLAPSHAIDVVIQILRAARFAHQRGVIHRDLKPQNVIVGEDGRARVTDFGIARAGASDMTETGSIMGTAQYLSPEQAQGHGVTAQSDLYAIGIVLYELLTARVPFSGDSPVTIALKQVAEAPVPPSAYNQSVPQELDAIVLRALEKEPSDRFTDADEFIAALEQVRAGLTSTGGSTAVFGAVAAPATAGTDLAVAPVPVPLTDEELAAEAYPAEPLPPEPEREGHRGAWVAVAVILLVAAALVLFFATRPEQVTVPNVVGSQLGDASARLRNAGFDVEVERVQNDAPRDRVLREDPQPGTEVDQGSAINLTVSDGPGQTGVPDVARLPRAQAIRELERAGFQVKLDQEASDSIPRGDATRTAPPGGSQADRGSDVTLFVSSGPGQVAVPEVVGQSEASAEGELAAAGFTVSVSEEDSEGDPGRVLSQSPGAGTEVEKGSAVSIVVSREAPPVDVPAVVGETEAAARAALARAGFDVGVREVTVQSRDEAGLVQSQDPPAGDRARRGTSVTIVVGRFTEPPPADPPPGDQ